MSNTEQLKEGILNQLNREVDLCKILDEKVDNDFIKELEDKFIEMLKSELKKYE